MIILDRYESHLSIEFEEFYKEKNIIIFYLPPYSSYLTQLLDISYFSILKRSYSRELEAFIKTYINYITKIEFLIAFKTAYISIMTTENVQIDFRDTSLIPYNPQAILSKLDIKLRTPTPTGPPLLEIDAWVSQTPQNPIEAISQSEFVQKRITKH